LSLIFRELKVGAELVLELAAILAARWVGLIGPVGRFAMR
jgi:hypothetical protein